MRINLRSWIQSVGEEGCPPRAPMGPEPLRCPARGRRVHEEQIEASTRAVYPGSGRGGRVKPYSCLVCIGLESSGARRASYTERMSDLASERRTEPNRTEPLLRWARASFYSVRGHRQVST